MSIKLKVIGLNRFLTTIYGEQTQLSSVLLRLGLKNEQIEVIKSNHLEFTVDAFIGLVQQSIVDRRSNSERLYKIICRRFSLDGKQPSTLQFLGEELGISRERVHQLERKALKSYKTKAYRNFLENGLFEISASILPELQEYRKEKLVGATSQSRVNEEGGNHSPSKKWSHDELLLLKQKYSEGMTIQDLATLLGRSDNSVTMRLNKGWQLQAAREYVEENFSYQWIPVYQNASEKYLFPGPITSFMLENYGKSAVYRWIAREDNEETVVYVGSTHKLCPDRLDAYLSNEPKGVNKRLRSTFLAYVADGHKLELEILSFDTFVITPSHLSVGHVRYFVENLFINYYQQRGHMLLNKSVSIGV